MNFDDESLRQSMGRALAGDKIAYRFVLDQSQRWLISYFRRRLPPGLIDDVIQETLVSLHTKRQSFDPMRPFLPWLAAIARYRWIDALRKMRDTYELEPDTLGREIEEPVIARLSLDRLMSHLPAAQSNVIILTRIEGRSVAEAAAICGQSEAAVKVNVHRGLRKLATLVESD